MRPTSDRPSSAIVAGQDDPIVGGRVIAAAAVVYVLAWLVGLAIGFSTSGPGPGDPAQAIGAYFASHRQIAMIQAYLLDGVAGIALVVFAASLRAGLRRWDGSGTWSDVLFGAGVAAGTVSLIQGLFTQVLADQVAATNSAPVIQALYALNTEGDTYKLLAVGVFMAATATIVFRTRALPVWTAWLGAVLAPLLVVSGWNFAWSAQAQYLAYAVLLLGIFIWVGAVGVSCWRKAERREAAEQPGLRRVA